MRDGRAREYQDKNLRGLTCKRLRIDEIGLVDAKDKNVLEAKKGEAGGVWTWTAIDADTKLIPSFYVGGRDAYAERVHARSVGATGQSRAANLGWPQRLPGCGGPSLWLENDFAMLVKHYGPAPERSAARRYRPTECVAPPMGTVASNPNRKTMTPTLLRRPTARPTLSANCRKPLLCAGHLLHALQLHPHSSNASCQPIYGRWRDEISLDNGGCCEDLG